MIGMTSAEIALGLGLGLVVAGFDASWEGATVKGKVICLTVVIAGIVLLAGLMILKLDAGGNRNASEELFLHLWDRDASLSTLSPVLEPAFGTTTGGVDLR